MPDFLDLLIGAGVGALGTYAFLKKPRRLQRPRDRLNDQHAALQLELEIAYLSLTADERKAALAVARTEIIDAVHKRVQWLVNDCETFRLVRSEYHDWYSAGEGNSTTPGLGGGNLMMAMTQFAALSFLAKVYRFLMTPERFYSWAEWDAASNARAEAIAQLPSLKANLQQLSLKRAGECVEEDAFWVLVKELNKSGIHLGITSDEQAKLVWKGFRNTLAHMASPQRGFSIIVSVGPSVSNESIKRDFPTAFTLNGQMIGCNADRLALDLIPIVEWICQRINRNKDHERLLPIHHWLLQHQPHPLHWSTEESVKQ